MSNESKSKYDKIFCDIFELNQSDLNEKLEYNTIETWDSIGHMAMVAEIEDTFDITFDTDDIVNFSSYNIGKEIMGKYGIAIE
ncbi:MAG: acyl carrier protein [Halobacteriovoraceae bacterium]|nr:acyl carrier protein [Halobacteriovoraceae bacterium]|tara:strand:- start:1929 stop:2177 length:249 start_codon:yes stop_codon:yes gene_type:complete